MHLFSKVLLSWFVFVFFFCINMVNRNQIPCFLTSITRGKKHSEKFNSNLTFATERDQVQMDQYTHYYYFFKFKNSRKLILLIVILKYQIRKVTTIYCKIYDNVQYCNFNLNNSKNNIKLIINYVFNPFANSVLSKISIFYLL